MARATGALSAANQTVEIDVSACSHVTAYFSGSAYNVNVAFEGSDGTNWSPLGFTVAHSPSQNSLSSVSLDNTLGPRSYHLDRPGVLKTRIRAISVTSGSIDVVLDSYGTRMYGAPADEGGTDVVDAVLIQGQTQQNFAISTSGAQASAGASIAGVYDFSSDVDCYLKIAPSSGTASDVTTSTGEPLYAGNVVPHRLAVNDRPGAITATGSGTLRYIWVHA
jgi:hypothetical protein